MTSPRPRDPKALIWDIEATNLSASFGTILCVGYKWLGQKRVHVPTILDHTKDGMLDDKGLVAEFARVYSEADYTVAHYGSRYDLPMIKTKLVKYGLPPLPPKLLIDTWRIARRELKMHSNRLNALAGFLGTKHQKTEIKFDDWLRAAHGEKKAMAEVVDHCRLDVLALEDVFVKLRPLAIEEPVRGLWTGEHLFECVSCGSTDLQRRGFHVSRTRRYQRFQCQTCGKWQRRVGSERDQKPQLIGGWA